MIYVCRDLQLKLRTREEQMCSVELIEWMEKKKAELNKSVVDLKWAANELN